MHFKFFLFVFILFFQVQAKKDFFRYINEKFLLFQKQIYQFFYDSHNQESDYSEQYRPQYHYSPPNNWINDPNGLFQDIEGTYHLFYQYNPEGEEWGHMSWGHATSNDLINWEVLPVAIPEKDGIMAFSGSAVIDHKNSTGFQPTDSNYPPYVAIYTGSHENGIQDQRLAYSIDGKGIEWQMYEGNPVLSLNVDDFRDPKVFIYDDQWYMIVARSDEQKVLFYSSENLINWTYQGEFQTELDAQWECPDLIQMQDGLWILVLNSNPGGYNGGSGAYYMIGNFDGKQFSPLNNEFKVLDFGKDYYAVTSFFRSQNQNLETSPNLIAWMSNWQYAQQLPTTPWKGQMTFPRQFQIKEIEGKKVVIQQFSSEALNNIVKDAKLIYSQNKNNHLIDQQDTLAYNKNIKKSFIDNNSAYLRYVNVTFLIEQDSEPFDFGIVFGKDDNGQYIKFTMNSEKNTFQFNRQHSGKVDFSEDFASSIQNGYLPCEKIIGCGLTQNTQNDKIHLNVQLLIDNCSAEIQIANGAAFITELIFPQGNHDYMEFFGSQSIVEIYAIKGTAPYFYEE
ncbi:Glycosyl hydrolase, five-bladed beta-propellor domain [Pseudocohnilembus persalinus]|uniref:Glycosyl hydrolase, five-bladed beta-propellor domain n=1 Tax=Pseudocohnilembus persalinus TaxID=266149 RepID=A0A0V0R6D8_PSEPJ|nr:Glycosyl hydrolase, five-bladed beta-propellor domain [Pseudocohnilembus persalinus]|eukprot:KRX10077.1 Glycosyl hydrolase, five-bladed beta-propellor domain [Pseudocohnilembus persalinus]